MPRPTRPLGQPTRGKTAENRLRQADVYVALAMPRALRGESPLAVDLGFGAKPWTTLEMADRWRKIEPTLRVLGIEIDPERVAEAAPFAAPPATDFRLGGFNLAAVLGEERARVVRCFNVLRQYEESEVEHALAEIARGMEPGGVLIEGTSNPTGGMMVFDVWRRADATAAIGQRAGAGSRRAGVRNELPRPPRARRFPRDPAEAPHPPDAGPGARRLLRRLAAIVGDRPWTRHRGAETGVGRGGGSLRERFGRPVDPRRRLLQRGFLGVQGELR